MWLISIFHCRQPSRTSLIMGLSIKDGAGVMPQRNDRSRPTETAGHDTPKSATERITDVHFASSQNRKMLR